MKKVIIVFIVSTIIMFLSCDEQLILVKCADCTKEEPVETNLEVKLDISSGSVISGIIRLYEGNIEDNILLGTFSTIDLIWQHTVSVNTKYTISATYEISGATYVAIDSATPRVHYETEQCENPCYFVYDKIVNLRIKYIR